MYCKKCDKILPSDSTFCPYCGNEKLEAEAPAAEETVAEETATEEVAAEETVAENAEETVPATPVNADGDKVVEGKSGKGVIIGLLSAMVVLLAALVVIFAGKLFGTPDTPDTPDVTGGAETTDAPTVSDAELFPNDYVTVYPDGIDYLSFDMSEYITLGEYKGLTVTLTTSSEITDEDVQEYIANQLEAHATLEEVTDRPAANGDTVNIDFVGSIDGVEFEGGTATGSTLVIGDGGFIDGFEDGIIGMTVGEVKTIDAYFPENYQPTDLAGKTAQFKITLNSISENVVPEYNDQFVRDNFDIDTLPQFEAYVREVLAAEREEEILAEKQSGLLTQVTDNATLIKFPEGIVEDYMFQQIDSARFYGAMYYGMEYTEFIPAALGISAAEYEAEIKMSAEAAVKQELVLFAIFEDAGLTIEESERKEALDYYFEYYETDDIAALCEQLDVSEAYLENTITFTIVFEKVMDFLMESATFTGAE